MTAPPWVDRYAAGQPSEITAEFADGLSMFAATVARDPDADAVRYFDGRITFGELDALSDAFACGLLDAGLRPGERVALYLQNVPQFVIALVGAWKAGGIVVSVNPMYRARELELLLADSGAAVLVALRGLHADVARDVLAGTAVRTVVTTSEREFQTRDDPRAFPEPDRPTDPDTVDLAALLARFAGQRPPPVSYGPADVALLTYTSGTTGPPKGAMNTHAAVAFQSQVFRQWCSLTPSDVTLGVAPLFHITGLVAGITTTLLVGCPLVLAHRFEPAVTLETVREHGATFTVGSITVFIALMNVQGAAREDLATLTKIWSGGAPVAPATVAAFEEAFGRYVHNIYGLTETTSPSHATPYGVSAPVDPTSGALAVGVPVFGVASRIVDDSGRALPPGDVGEIAIASPGVVPGYWAKPDESAAAFPAGELRTGDVGYMDDDGWFYVVDRKKDQINAGGYKVWPREVEDVLYEHPAVREAAVVGVPDTYRGETVKAFVSLRAGRSADEAELVAFCKERMAAYKYPRQVEFLDELPKTVSGKLLRRELRGRG